MTDIQPPHTSMRYVAWLLLCVVLPTAVSAGPLQLRHIEWHSPTDQRLTSAHANLKTNVIPVAGFTPLLVKLLTDARSSNAQFLHMLEPSLTGSILAGSPESAYVIGLFDTGGVAHLMGYCEAQFLGLTGPLLTNNTVQIVGAGGIEALRVSQPLGVFVDGLDAINPDTASLDTSGLIGHSNVAILAGQSEDCIDGSELPTTISTVLSAFYTTVIRNDQPIRLQLEDTVYETPNLTFYPPGDANIPTYGLRVPLELRPPASDAGYIFTINIETFDIEPGLPTTLIGDHAGSRFFAEVQLHHRGRDATRQSFLVDTGAQISVLSSFTAGLLGVDPLNPDFTIDIEGGGGTVTDVPGFMIEELEIIALGGTLILQAAPVVLLDIASTEGGIIDGIIGTNIFNDRNIVFAGDLVTPYMDISEPITPTE